MASADLTTTTINAPKHAHRISSNCEPGACSCMLPITLGEHGHLRAALTLVRYLLLTIDQVSQIPWWVWNNLGRPRWRMTSTPSRYRYPIERTRKVHGHCYFDYLNTLQRTPRLTAIIFNITHLPLKLEQLVLPCTHEMITSLQLMTPKLLFKSAFQQPIDEPPSYTDLQKPFE